MKADMDDDRNNSTLPDEILYNSLSFLPTEQAVATSVLSKIWRPLWLSLTNINLDYESYLERFRSYSGLKSMIKKTFYERGVHRRPIERISIRGLPSCKRPDFLAMKLEDETGLDMLFFSPFVMPLPIFSFRALVFLKLKVISIEFGFYGRTINFPLLKTLHLNDVAFFDDSHFVRMLNGCPILEDLEAYDILFKGWSFEQEYCKDLPKLVRASISGASNSYIPLKALRNVKFLRFEQGAVEVPMFGDDTSWELNIPVFSNLTHLEVIIIEYYFSSLVKWLNNFPKLKCLVVDNPGSDHEVLHSRYQRFVLDYDVFGSQFAADEAMVYPSFVPECLSSQIRKCTLINYSGRKYERQFAEYIMQNSTCLQSMTIYCLPSLNLQEKLEILKELSLCPTSSPTCVHSYK